MLATEHTLDPEALYTINAAGFSATADAFARDPHSQGLWFLSMVGSQTALKAIWAFLLKQPPDVAHLIQGADGMALSGGYERCGIPYQTIGTWTTKIAKLPVSGGWHALVFTKMAQYAFEHDTFLLLAQDGRRGPQASLPLPGQAKPASPAFLLGGVAVATGTPEGRDHPAPIGGSWLPTAATPTPNPSRRTSRRRWLLGR